MYNGEFEFVSNTYRLILSSKLKIICNSYMFPFLHEINYCLVSSCFRNYEILSTAVLGS